MPDPTDPAAIAREAAEKSVRIRGTVSSDPAERFMPELIDDGQSFVLSSFALNGEEADWTRDMAVKCLARIILSALAPIVTERDAARAEVEKLHGLLDECQSFVICYCVGYAIQYRISADGSTLHPVHKEIVDRLAAALTTPPAGAKP